MPFPLVAIAIGAGIGALAGGMSGEEGWDWNKAAMGGVLGGVTGGVGAGALGGATTLGGASTLGTTAGAAKGTALGTSATAGMATSAGPLAANTAGLSSLGTSTAIPAGLSGTSALGSGLGSSLSGMGGPGIANVGMPPLQSSFASTAGSHGLGYKAPQASSTLLKSSPNVGNQFTKTGSQFMTDKTAGKGLDYDALGEGVKSMGKQVEQGEAERSRPMDHAKPPPLRAMTSGESSSIAKDLAAELQSIHASPAKRITPGLGTISTAAKGGIATRFGMMKTPSGSLTGGEIVGPGTGTSDTIRSAIYPDVASKLGASSSPIGQGHQVQNAALSDGEFVLTAKAVEGVGRNAGAPPGQEREFGSKLLDQAMNQWQRA